MNEVCLFDGMRVSVGNTEFRMSFNYSLSYPEIDEKQQTTAHDHSYIELHIVSEGVLHIKADKDYFIKKNELLMISPGIYHNTMMSEEKTMRYVVGIEMLKSSGGAEKTRDYFERVFGNFGCIKLPHCRNIVNILIRMRDQLGADRPFLQYRIKNYLMSLLFDVYDRAEAYLHPDQLPAPAADMGLNSEDRLCLALDAIVTLNAKNGFKTLDEISRELHLDKQQINRIMKRRYNMTFKQKQICSRIEYAKSILYQTDKPIDVIAYEIGYTNITSFYKNFKNIVGCTPNEFRSKARKTDKK